MAKKDEYLSTQEVADRYGITSGRVWQRADEGWMDFPEPDIRKPNGNLWKLSTLERWEKRSGRRKARR